MDAIFYFCYLIDKNVDITCFNDLSIVYHENNVNKIIKYSHFNIFLCAPSTSLVSLYFITIIPLATWVKKSQKLKTFKINYKKTLKHFFYFE